MSDFATIIASNSRRGKVDGNPHARIADIFLESVKIDLKTPDNDLAGTRWYWLRLHGCLLYKLIN